MSDDDEYGTYKDMKHILVHMGTIHDPLHAGGKPNMERKLCIISSKKQIAKKFGREGGKANIRRKSMHP